MRDRIESRIGELQGELEAGRGLQAELLGRQEQVERSLLRISGAIQVLQEVLQETSGEGAETTDESSNASLSPTPALHPPAAVG